MAAITRSYGADAQLSRRRLDELATLIPADVRAVRRIVTPGSRERRHATCSSCFKIYTDKPESLRCTGIQLGTRTKICGTLLGAATVTRAAKRKHVEQIGRGVAVEAAKLKAEGDIRYFNITSYYPVSAFLTRLLSNVDLERSILSYHERRQSSDDRLRDVWDGSVVRSRIAAGQLASPYALLFLISFECAACSYKSDRHSWLNLRRRSNGPANEIGPIWASVLNIPPELRNLARNMYMALCIGA